MRWSEPGPEGGKPLWKSFDGDFYGKLERVNKTNKSRGVLGSLRTERPRFSQS